MSEEEGNEEEEEEEEHLMTTFSRVSNSTQKLHLYQIKSKVIYYYYK